MNTTSRLRLAARIHFALLRHYGENVAISTLLEDTHAAREALWVCDASGNPDLAKLARQFRAAPKEMPRIDSAGNVAQDLAWSANTSGFRLTDIPGHETPPHPARRPRWLSAPRWWRAAR